MRPRVYFIVGKVSYSFSVEINMSQRELHVVLKKWRDTRNMSEVRTYRDLGLLGF